MKRTYIRLGILMMLLLLNSCGSGGKASNDAQQKDSNATNPAFSALQNIPLNESVLLTIPTYDGKNQVVHPDIMLRNGVFYMTITPYPWSNADHENPSIYVSSDGLHFSPPAKGVNPLVQHPDNGYNDDPDLVFNEESEKFFIYYNETPKAHDVQYLDLLSSTDGISWSQQRLITYIIKKGDPFIVSPAVIRAYDQYFMYHVDIDTENVHWCKPKDPYPHFIRLNTSPDGLHWDKEAEQGITIDYPKGFHPWHINVINGHDGRYYMLINGYNSSFCDEHNLYLAYSDGDMGVWHFINKPIVKADKNLFDSMIIYRSAAAVNGDDMYVYYSFKRYDMRWMLAVKHLSISKTLGGE